MVMVVVSVTVLLVLALFMGLRLWEIVFASALPLGFVLFFLALSKALALSYFVSRGVVLCVVVPSTSVIFLLCVFAQVHNSVSHWRLSELLLRWKALSNNSSEFMQQVQRQRFQAAQQMIEQKARSVRDGSASFSASFTVSTPCQHGTVDKCLTPPCDVGMFSPRVRCSAE